MDSHTLTRVLRAHGSLNQSHLHHIVAPPFIAAFFDLYQPNSLIILPRRLFADWLVFMFWDPSKFDENQ